MIAKGTTMIVTRTTIREEDVTKIGAKTKYTGLDCASKYHKNKTALDGKVKEIKMKTIHLEKIITEMK